MQRPTLLGLLLILLLATLAPAVGYAQCAM